MAVQSPSSPGLSGPHSQDQLAINTIRTLSIDAVQKANSGHPGLPLGAAPMAYVLWTRFLRHNPRNPHWSDRDRFVLSAGHGSALLYTLLYLTGYDLSLEDLKSFRQWGSRTPGHPEYRLTPGVEMTTGPLGQGFAHGVGEALAEAHLAATYNRDEHRVVDHYTYALASDGDLMEGVSSEAASLAGHFRLGKLIYLYDQNLVTLSGGTSLTFEDDVVKRFESVGWQVLTVSDGNDLDAIQHAIEEARAETGRPSLIAVRTILGYGSPHKAGTFAAHGSPLGVDEVAATKQALGWPYAEPFTVPDEARHHFLESIERGAKLEEEWSDRFEAYKQAYPDLAAQFERTQSGALPPDWDAHLPTFTPQDGNLATRSSGARVINAVAQALPELIGGSADLNPSTDTALKDAGDFQSGDDQPADRQGAVGGVWGYAGRNVSYGVREHAMGGITDGLAYHGGLIPFSATFFAFTDYMRPPMRLAALSELGSIFVFTHDSIGLGEDGPTHQPVEQLAGLRSMPGMVVFRPADANEVVEGWRVAIERRHGPTTLVLSRQAVPTFDRAVFAPAEGARRGAYVLVDAPSHMPQVILIATGTEVSLAVEARDLLARTEPDVQVRVVSMPSWELFSEQPIDYRQAVLPPSVRARVAIEAASSFGWERWVGDAGAVLAVDRFGASAPGPEVYKHLGFTPEGIVDRVHAVLSGQVNQSGTPAGAVSADRASFSKAAGD